MQDFMTFASNHSFLSIGIAVLLFVLIIVEFLRAKRGTGQLNTLQATQMINHDNAVVIDIRPNELYVKGHIIDAYSLTPKDMQQNPKKIEKFRNRPIILVCGTGVDSQKLATSMHKNGYNAYSLAGGVRSWTEAQLPLVKK